jgi:hypothetical protein
MRPVEETPTTLKNRVAISIGQLYQRTLYIRLIRREITMEHQQPESVLYNVVSVNMFDDSENFLLYGTWDGNLETSPILHAETEIDNRIIELLIKPPIIIDGIDHRNDTLIREYAYDLRHFVHHRIAPITFTGDRSKKTFGIDSRIY